MDVELSPSYLMLTAGSLEGETKRKFQRAAADAAALWPLLGAVDNALALANDEADKKGFRKGSNELARLLRSRWIAVPGGSFQPDRRFSPAEAIEELRVRFEAIREGAALVDQLWLELLPRLDAAKLTLARLDDEAANLGVREPLVGRARATVVDLEARLLGDPLGIAEGAPAELDDAVALAASQMAQLRSGHDALGDDLKATEVALARLRVLRSGSAATRISSLAGVLDPEGLIHTPGPQIIDGPGGLAEQLDALFEGTTSWVQRRTLLDGWLKSVDRLKAQLERAEAANRAPLNRRGELRGRLTAYRAKMAAVGRGEDLRLSDLADEARAELYTAPVDLDRAAGLIDQLANELRA